MAPNARSLAPVRVLAPVGAWHAGRFHGIQGHDILDKPRVELVARVVGRVERDLPAAAIDRHELRMIDREPRAVHHDELERAERLPAHLPRELVHRVHSRVSGRPIRVSGRPIKKRIRDTDFTVHNGRGATAFPGYQKVGGPWYVVSLREFLLLTVPSGLLCGNWDFPSLFSRRCSHGYQIQVQSSSIASLSHHR